ncbi:MAG: hypothetical protein MUP67_08640, partial [Acidimicrobiia bacterium]|nr:hypothetical protein [Acidimicrobiia bacterium]
MVRGANGESDPDDFGAMPPGDGGTTAPGGPGLAPLPELEQRASEVLEAAREAAAATGRAMVAEARGVRRRMLDDAERRRRELVSELERVRAMLDDAIAALGADAVVVDDAAADESPAEVADEVADEIKDDAAPPAPEPDDAALEREPGDAGVEALFASLRSEPTAVAPQRGQAAKPPTEPTPPSPSTDPSVTLELELETETEHEPETPDAVARRRRAAVLDPLVPEVVRASKRLLQDEQNGLLDAVRRARGRLDPGRLLPDLEHQRDAWVELLGPGADGAYLGGRAAVGKTGRVTAAPARVVAELVGAIVRPLRERLTQTIERVVADGPYESSAELQRVVGSAVGARYREWRGAELETRVVDVLCAAYARGSYDGAGPAAPLRWVPGEPGRCPDCDDNALEPTPKGGTFPTGQHHPPAHPGCRCLIVLAG